MILPQLVATRMLINRLSISELNNKENVCEVADLFRKALETFL